MVTVCGLFYESTTQSQAQKPVPLQNVKYSVDIRGPVAHITLTQLYRNSSSVPVNVIYCFPRSQASCFYSFEATFKERKVVGTVKQKDQARQEFQEEKRKGNFVGYAELKDESPDIVKCELGNFPAGEDLTIEFCYAEPLDLVANQMWRMIVPSTLTPRYTLKDVEQNRIDEGVSGDSTAHTLEDEIIDGVTYSQNLQYTWDISVRIHTTDPAINIFCGTHRDCVCLEAIEGSTCISLSKDRPHYPNRDFEVMFCDPSIHAPHSSIMKTARTLSEGTLPTRCAMMHLVPDFYNFAKAGPQGVQNAGGFEETGYNLENVKGEYIFVVDRSGSMSGHRIELAKKALTVAIKSLPYDSFFNICSFGSSFSMFTSQATKTSEQTIEKALNHITSMSANLGGTEILRPLLACFNAPPIKNYQRTIYLFTDGSVDDEDRCISETEIHCLYNKCRMFTMGIGNGVSQHFISGLAKAGNGCAEYIQDALTLEDKTVSVLNASFSVSLTEFEYEFDKNKILALSPQLGPQSHLLRGKPLQIMALIANDATGIIPVKLTYFDQSTNSTQSIEFQLDLAHCETGELYHKLLVKDLADNCRKVTQPYHLSTELVTGDWTAELPVAYQTLTRETAFICLIDRPDGVQEMAKTTVMVEPPCSIDYDDQPSISQASHNVPTAIQQQICVPTSMNHYQAIAELSSQADCLSSNAKSFDMAASSKKKSNSSIFSGLMNLFGGSKSKRSCPLPPPAPRMAMEAYAPQPPPQPAPRIATEAYAPQPLQPNQKNYDSYILNDSMPQATAFKLPAIYAPAMYDQMDMALAINCHQDIAGYEDDYQDECFDDCEDLQFDTNEESEYVPEIASRKMRATPDNKVAPAPAPAPAMAQKAECSSHKEQESKPKPAPATPSGPLVDQLIKLQKFDGNWTLDAELAARLGFADLAAAATTAGHQGDLLMTLLVLAWLDKHGGGQGKLALIVNKAMSYVKRQGEADCGSIKTKLQALI